MRCRALSVGLCLAILAPTPLWAASEPVSAPAPVAAPADALAGLLDANAVFAAAQKVVPAAFPNADQVMVDNLARVVYRADGTATRVEETYTKVLTEKGRRDAQVGTFDYNVFYDDFAVLALELHKPDGRVVMLDPDKLGKEMVADSSAMNIYDPAERHLALAIQGVEIGDLVRIVTRLHGKKPRIAGVFSDGQELESSSPILHSRYEVSGPPGLPLKAAKVLDPVAGGTVAESKVMRDGREWRVWEAAGVPQFFPEPGMPEAWSCVQRLAVSTAGSWEEVSRWYFGLCKDHLGKTTPQMLAKAQEIMAGAKDRQERIRRVFRFVSQDIRYMGVMDETCAPGYEPHDVSLTFSKRYGVCRDKAALLVAMLNLVGEKAFPVLIMSGPRLPEQVPAPMFNHAITALLEADGSYHLMDSTDENSANDLPGYLQNCSFLVARPEGETLHVSPVVPAQDGLARCRTRAELLADGSLAGTLDLQLGGINDNITRNAFAAMAPQDIRRVFEERIKTLMPGARLTAFALLPKDIRDIAHPLEIHLEFKAPDAVREVADKTFLNIPWCGRGFGIANRILAGSCGLEDRRFPLNIQITCGAREDLEVKLPPTMGKLLALPASHDIDSPELRFRQSLRLEGDTLKGQFELLLQKPEISPAGYAKLRRAVAEMGVAAREEPIFANGQAAADIRLLSDKTSIEVEDAHSWTETWSTRKEVLTYGGKKAAGEIRIPYNPAWTKVELRKARVIAKDGSFKDISPKEINLLDAPWVADAPRYPAGKILVASLPGLEVGSVVETQVILHRRDRVFFSDLHWFSGFDPCEKSEYEVTYPPSLAVTVDDRAGGSAGAGRFYVQRALVTLPHEPGMADPQNFAPAAALSAGDGVLLGKAVARALAQLGDGGKTVADKAREVAKVAGSLAAKVAALRNFMDQDIRSAGPGFTEVPLSALSRPETTLADGYGSEADRAILLDALLRAAGIPSRLVLAAADPAKALEPRGRRLQGDFYDNLVCIATVDGRDLMLDNPSQYAALGASALDGCPLLELDGHARLCRVDAPFHRQVRRAFDIRLQADGSAILHVCRQFTGADYQAFCQQYAQITPEDRRRLFEEMLSSLAPDAKAASGLKTDLGYPGTLAFDAKLPHFAISGGPYLYFDLPDAVSCVSGDALSDRRVTPLLQSYDDDTDATWSVTLPEGYTLKGEAPAFHWQGPGHLGGVRIEGKQEGGVLTVRERVDLNPEVIQPANYPALVEVNRRLAHAPWRVLLQAVPKEAAK